MTYCLACRSQKKLANCKSIIFIVTVWFTNTSLRYRIQGDMNGWMNLTDPVDDTLTFNKTGLVSIHDIEYFHFSD